MKFIVLASAAAAFVAPVAAHAATAITFNTANCSSNSKAAFACAPVVHGAYVDNGKPGNAVKITGSDSTTQMKVSAWQMDQKNGAVTSAWLGAYNGYGLGVTGKRDSLFGFAGAAGTHQIDNLAGYTDFVLLQFNNAVHLDGVGLKSFGIAGALGRHNDYSVFNALELTPALWDGKVDMASLAGSASRWANMANTGADGVSTVGSLPAASGFSKVWLVGASMATSDRDDAFKLTSIRVTPGIAAVPEPATWGMMIVGFGAVGASLRRRRGSGAALAA